MNSYKVVLLGFYFFLSHYLIKRGNLSPFLPPGSWWILLFCLSKCPDWISNELMVPPTLWSICILKSLTIFSMDLIEVSSSVSSCVKPEKMWLRKLDKVILHSVLMQNDTCGRKIFLNPKLESISKRPPGPTRIACL